MTILGLGESCKTKARPGTRYGLKRKKYKRWGREILTQSLFKSLICAIKI